jgi:murein DD-endopeptidase MepM/ murein hydrolase activator NlpD
MIDRRHLLALMAFAAAGPLARAQTPPSRLTLTGPLEQGSLVVGRTDPGTQVLLDGKPLHLSSGGVFAFGFQFDQTTPAKLEAHFVDRTSETREVAPVIRKYDIQRINGLPETLVTPPAEIEARIQKEHASVYEARKIDSDSLAFAQPFDWPAAGIISGVFGSQRVLNGEPKAPHFGVDIAAPVGTPIHAPADGVVTNMGDYYLEGGFTMLDHGHGVSTSYFHQSKHLVQQGDRVARGSAIGLVGQTGRATGPHVHWGMNWFQVRLDPSRSASTPAPSR